MKKKNPVAKAVRTETFRMRVVKSKKRKLKEKVARREMKDQLPPLIMLVGIKGHTSEYTTIYK